MDVAPEVSFKGWCCLLPVIAARSVYSPTVSYFTVDLVTATIAMDGLLLVSRHCMVLRFGMEKR